MAGKLDPTKHRVLLVGPRVVHLRQFFEKRRYPVVAAGKGVEGMAQLDTSPCDIVVLELNLGDLTATEFLMAARQGHPQTTFLLLDESTKAGQIVKALQAGLDGYLATPPDEDRLFYEVERHLARGGAAKPGATNAGFDELSTQTAMQSMAEAAALQAAVADRDSQVIELNERLKATQDSLRPLRETARRYDEVQQVLGSVIDGSLDAAAAQRLREQVQLAQVAEIEIDSLRRESTAARDAKSKLQSELDDALRKLRLAASSVVEDKSARVDELEAEVMVLEGRLQAAEEAVAAANEAASVSDDDATEAQIEVKALQEELEQRESRISSLEIDLAAARDSSSSSSAAELDKERTAHKEALQALKKTHDDELGRLKQAAEKAQAELESERARAAEEDIRRSAREEDAIADAVAQARASLEAELGARHAAALKDARAGAAGDVESRLAAQAREQEERSAAAAARLADEVREAKERATDVELQLEEARMRIDYLEENAATVTSDANERIARAEAEFKKEKLRLIEERQSAASGSQEAALRMERFVKENSDLKKHAAELEAMRESLESKAAAALAAADRAREELLAASERVAGASESQQRMEAALGGVQAHARSLEGELDNLRAALSAKGTQVDELQARLDAAAAAHEALQRQHADALVEARNDGDVSRLRADIDALRAELLSSEAARATLNDEVARVRTEAQAVHAQAQQRMQDIEPISAERDQLAARLEEAIQEATAARDELAIARQIGEQAATNSTEELQARIAELETAASTNPLLATVRSLVEAIEPLRWGLGSAIDYMYPFESNDQQLATHVRNLRLLQATLTRLAAESGRES